MPEVKHFYSLKVQTAGADTFITVNVNPKPDLSLRQVHDICDRIERELNSLIQRSEVIIRAEPQVLAITGYEECDGKEGI